MADPRLSGPQQTPLVACDCSGLQVWTRAYLAQPLVSWRGQARVVRPIFQLRTPRVRRWLFWSAIATGVGVLFLLAWFLLTPRKTVRASLW
jgi:hypothetical protein